MYYNRNGPQSRTISAILYKEDTHFTHTLRPAGMLYIHVSHLLNHNLLAIYDIDAFEAFGVGDTATMEVVDEF